MEKDEKKETKKTSTKKATSAPKKETKKVEKKSQVKNEPKKEEKVKVKDDAKKEKKVQKVEPKKEEVKEKTETETKVEVNVDKKANKVSSASSDKVAIFTIVGVCLLIALSVFVFVFYKSNYEPVVKTKYGNVNKAEYTVYYKMFAPMLEYYGYAESSIPQVIANKCGTDKILLKKAKDAGITLSAEDAAEIEKTFSDKEQVKSWQESEINVEILRRLFEEDYIISAYIQKLANDATDEEMLQYLKDTYGDSADLYEYNTRHILIKTTTTADDGTSKDMTEQEKAAALQKAQSILSRVKAGEDFAKLATELSEDTGTAVDGGAFTFYDGDSIMEEFEKAAKSLNDGQIYDSVVETSAGYHIIKLDSKVKDGKINSSTERNYYANEIINKLSSEEEIDIRTEVLNALITSITGKSPDADVTEEEDEGTNNLVVETENTVE